MPLREYVCKACGRAFEVLERTGEKASCPGCGSKKLEKQLSAFSARKAAEGCAAGCPAAEAGACGGHHHHGAGCGCGCH